jgi:hypothetical protein
MKPVHECWLSARGELLPQGHVPCPAEERELRRVFFVGALCLWQMQQGFKDLPPEHRAQFEAALRDELNVFRATVGTTVEGLV